MKDFDQESAERRRNRPRRPIEDRQFKLGGEVLAYAEVVPAQAVIGLGVALKSDDPSIAATSLSDAILSLLDPECHSRFYNALDARDENGWPLVENDQLTELYGWLMEQVANRPPTQPSVSLAPPPTNGTTSTDASLSPGPTSPVSTSAGS